MNICHTPGPWKFQEPNDNSLSVGYRILTDNKSNTGMSIASVYHDLPNGEANAKLITAAPDLLEALNEIMRLFEPGLDVYDEPYSDAIILAHAAIRKATRN